MAKGKTTQPARSGRKPKTYSAERVRQGEIILRKPWQKAVFFAGLIGCVVLLLALYFAAAR